jgi:hypothetical protein
LHLESSILSKNLPTKISYSLLCKSRKSLLYLIRGLNYISHRATNIDPSVRMQRLMDFITPIKQLWQNPQLDEALSSFSGFCELLGIGKVRDYLVSHRVHEIADWSTLKLDDEGQAMQAELNERVKVLWSYICSTGDHGADLA